MHRFDILRSLPWASVSWVFQPSGALSLYVPNIAKRLIIVKRLNIIIAYLC